MPTTRAQSRVMRAQLDSLPLELLRLIIDRSSTSIFDKQITRTNLSMVNKRVRAILAPDMRNVVWFSPRELELVPLHEDTVARLKFAETLVVSSPPRRPEPIFTKKTTREERIRAGKRTRSTDGHAILRVLERFNGIRELHVLSPPDCAWQVCSCFEASCSSSLQHLRSIYIDNCRLRFTFSVQPARFYCKELVIKNCDFYPEGDLAGLLERGRLQLHSLQTIRLGPTAQVIGRKRLPRVCPELLTLAHAVQIDCTPFFIPRGSKHPDPSEPPTTYFETETPVLYTLNSLIPQHKSVKLPDWHPPVRTRLAPETLHRARFIQLAELDCDLLSDMTTFLAALPDLRAVFIWRRLHPRNLDGPHRDAAEQLVKSLDDREIDVVFTEPDDYKFTLPESMTYLRQRDMLWSDVAEARWLFEELEDRGVALSFCHFHFPAFSRFLDLCNTAFLCLCFATETNETGVRDWANESRPTVLFL